MNMQFDLAKSEINNRLHQAEQRRFVYRARPQRPGLVRRLQRHRSP